MNQATKDLLQQEYRRAVLSANSGIRAFQTFYENIQQSEIFDEDSDTIDAFIDGIRGTLRQREKYKEMDKMINSIKITFHYISIWQNSKINVEFTSRMKSVGSTLAKLLSKSLATNESISIRDTYGIRGISKNEEDDEKESIQHIYNLYNAFLGIVAQRSRKKKAIFQEWLSTREISKEEKEAISYVMNCPFAISYVKDYIQNPKSNGYQSLQFTLSIPMYSEILPGAQIEVQLRTESMHWVATEGPAAHEDYKDDSLREVKNIFTIQ